MLWPQGTLAVGTKLPTAKAEEMKDGSRDGPTSLTDAAGPSVGWARTRPGTTVWNNPGVRIERTRSWNQTSVVVMRQGPSEGFWRSDQPRVCLPLINVERLTNQIEGGQVREVKIATPHHLFFCPPRASVRAVHTGPEAPWVQIAQATETYRDLALEISSPISVGDFEPLVAVDDPQTALLVQSIVNEIDGGVLDELLVNALNTALAVRVARRFRGPAMRLPSAGRLSRERLKRVLDYIEAHLASPLSLGQLAAVACLSPYHFGRCFRRSMGVGPYRYVLKRRIQRARHLLLHSDMPLTGIAEAVGFDSQSSLTARFSREVGVSPGRLRRERA
jgi:AraC-like DNA-binding protein